MSTFNSPVDIVAATLAKSTNLNDLDAAVAIAFSLLPTEANLTRGTTQYAVDTGTANNYLVALPHTPSGYVDGLRVTFRPINTNTGASTINVNSLGVKSIRLTSSAATAAGDITVGAPITVYYSTSTGFFHLAPNSTTAATAAALSAATATTQAGTATTKAGEASTSATNASASETNASNSAASASTQATNSSSSAATAANYAVKVDGYASGTDNSSKSWAVGGTGAGQPTEGNAKLWATKATTTVDGTSYSAKEMAIGDSTASGGSAKAWATDASSPDGTAAKSAKTHAEAAAVTVTDVNVQAVGTNLLGPNTIGTVAGIASHVTTVAGISAAVSAVNTNATNVNTVATNIANVNTVGGISGNVTTVAGISASTTTVAGIAANVTTVSGIAAAVSTVSTNNANVSTVATNIANVNTVGGISANVTTLAGISTSVTTVADISANVTTVAGVAANVTTVADISANVTTVAGVASAVSTNATNIASVNTNATNIVAIQNASANAASASNSATAAAASYDSFDDRYLGPKATAPTLDNDGAALLVGALYFDTATTVLRVYSGSAWANTVTTAAGVSSLNTLTGDVVLKTVNSAALTGAGNIVTAVLEANTFTGVQTFKAGADIASATAVDLTAATGNTVVITGTVTSTSLTMTAGQQMVLLPSGAWPLTYNATTMNINGGVSYTAAAGDRILAVKDLAGVVRVSVTKQDGTAVIGGAIEVITPSNITPSDSATDIGETPTFTGSSYFSLYSLPQSAIQLQVNTSDTFTSPQYSSGDQTAGVSFTIPSGELVVSTQYYWRLRYKNSNGVYSDWSTATSFTTAAAFTNYIDTPASTPAAFGDAFEGGFYSGLIWNQVDQSVTSTAIGTGSKTFATDIDQSSTPLFYSGQALEIRSRADPDNKMIGTVTFAGGTSLTINVTSVGGSGTFTDWSIMSKYRLIVAPKSSGESASKAYKNANTAAPSDTGTLTEGLKATLAMVAAGTSTVYPAAHFCNDLNIGSKTDWYLPARDELELCWRNLKPTTDNNYTTADRPTAATPDYENLGSYGDTANTHGLNNNSSPQGAAYTSGSPAQTAATAFRTGGAEAFEYGSAYYWSSSEYSASRAWFQRWFSSLPGYQGNGGKTSAYRVRAVRRSII